MINLHINLLKTDMLRKLRIILAALFFAALTLLFLDFTGALHAWLGWTAKVQALEAVLALNFAVIIGLVLVTLLFGRVYCSVICPLGITQDIIAWIHGNSRKNRYSFRKANNWLRYGFLAAFIVLMLFGINAIACLIAPYSAYGKIAAELMAPVYGWCNNLFATIAQRADSYTFYPTEVWMKSLPTFIVAAVTFVLIFILAWKGGRTWCNSVCPVGSVLGLVSRFSLFKPVIDTGKCTGCTLCARRCKSKCINPKEHAIDYSRCVVCMDCLENCKQGAISYKPVFLMKSKKKEAEAVNESRRSFIAAGAMLLSAATLQAKRDKVKTGSAMLQEKLAPARKTPVKPAGSQSLKNFSDKCVTCQLCVTKCPYGVLRPSTDLATLMQPEMSFEKGFCRINCTECSSVCPAGAIKPISVEDKSSIRVGHAVVIPENCVVKTDEVSCGNCARHCPAGAITLVAVEGKEGLKVPAVNAELCIGCGSCEYHCPARPFSAIYVEGNEIHSIA